MAKYFTIKELCKSNSHPELVEIPQQGTQIYNNINYLIERLDVIREKWGSPIIVTSGYRPPALNKAVRGSQTSAHLTGLAADIRPEEGNIIDLARIIATLPMEYDQLILEYITEKDGEITGCKWIHIGFSRNRNRGQILAYDGKKYIPVKVYEKPILTQKIEFVTE